jgi:hypothetical protein
VLERRAALKNGVSCDGNAERGRDLNVVQARLGEVVAEARSASAVSHSRFWPRTDLGSRMHPGRRDVRLVRHMVPAVMVRMVVVRMVVMRVVMVRVMTPAVVSPGGSGQRQR